MEREKKFEYGFESVNGIVKKAYNLHEIPSIKEKCDVWGNLPIKYVRQFTGLKDKNGKEIYEGDIVRVQGMKKIGIYVTDVIYEAPMFKLRRNDTYLYDFAAIKQCEIIGNIYETPSLQTNN